MITIYDAELTDILPSKMKDNPDMIALSYAISKEVRQLKSFIEILDCFSDINKMPDALCDYMAAELDALYYDKALPIERKRELIKTAVQLHEIAGSYKAIKTVVSAVLGESKVYEWYEIGADVKPYQFDVITPNTLSKESLDYLNRIVKKVKPTRSILRNIKINHRRDIKSYIGACGNTVRLKEMIYE